MRCLLLCTLLLLNQITYGKVYDKIITPLAMDKLEDEDIKQDIIAAITSDITGRVYEYKISSNSNVVISSYKGGDWMFCAKFNTAVRTINQERNNKSKITCSSSQFSIDNIRFYHVKYMLLLDNHSLSFINEKLLSPFIGKPTNCEIKSYISKDSLKNYLRLTFYNTTLKSDFVFIINKSEFYCCVQIS